MTGDYLFGGVVWRLQLQNDANKRLFAPFSVESQENAESVPSVFGDAYEESNGILRYVNQTVLERFAGLVMHGGALVYGGKAYLFVAAPGTGKTTHMRLWLKCEQDAAILCGDKPILRLENGVPVVYASPWQGKENYGFVASYPLGGIYLLRRGTEDCVVPVTTVEALPTLLDATFFAELPHLRPQILQLLDAIAADVPLAALYCTISPKAVEVVRAHIKGETL